MRLCDFCNQPMNIGCTVTEYDDMPGGPYARIAHDDEDGKPCSDCAAPSGALHHPGCDRERCPKCGDQAIGCGCADGEDDSGLDS